MELLIIGGTGVLSGAVAKEAVKQGIVVTILHRGTKPHMIPTGAKSIIVDVNNDDAVRYSLSKKHFDCIIDFICYNKRQLQHSFELFHAYTDQYVFVSTTCVYDALVPGVKNESSKKLFKPWDYSVEKCECEEYLVKASTEVGVPYTIIRPCVTYDNSRIPYGLVPVYGYHWTFIGRILNNKPVLTWGQGKARWNLMRVEDFAVGVVGTFGNSNAYYQAYNVSGDEAYSWQEVLNSLSKVIKYKIDTYDISPEDYMNLEKTRKGEIYARSLDSIVDNRKIKELVPNFKTTIDLDEGVRQVVNYYKEHNYLKGIDYAFDGSIDRIIAQHAKLHNISTVLKNLKFVDYLGNATIMDRLAYLCGRYSGSFLGKVLWKIKIIVSKIFK